MLAFFGIPSATFILKKLNYSKTEYKFFADHLEFDEGFFSRSKKIISYRNISEITLKKGLFQSSYNPGTIYLATLATGSGARYDQFYAFGFGNVSASGVGVQDVYDPDAVYARLRALIDGQRT